MFSLSVKITRMPDFALHRRQIRFATARALTDTAKDAQTAVLSSLKDTFTLRGNWFDPKNKLGIRITPATKTNLTAEVKTAAKFLKLHEDGGEKFPYGRFIAVPTENVRRNKRQIIARSQRPKNLKNSVILTGKSNVPVLFQRKGRGKNRVLTAMYVLIPQAKISKQSVFAVPAANAARRNWDKNFKAAWNDAIKTAN